MPTEIDRLFFICEVRMMAYNSAQSISGAISPWQKRWGAMAQSSLWLFG
ncbi:MAG: hypothetical protein HC922_09735 [Leptolyngbyaceae cyanobacterium SM2_3_12]|nr:hypothetical protein [Leptolyngbyaceae cyanobacterium SM2_3_12]